MEKGNFKPLWGIKFLWNGKKIGNAFFKENLAHCPLVCGRPIILCYITPLVCGASPPSQKKSDILQQSIGDHLQVRVAEVKRSDWRGYTYRTGITPGTPFMDRFTNAEGGYQTQFLVASQIPAPHPIDFH